MNLNRVNSSPSSANTSVSDGIYSKMARNAGSKSPETTKAKKYPSMLYVPAKDGLPPMPDGYA